MRSSYSPDDVTILLKEITGLIPAPPTEERERRIQGGGHYSEMLPVEYRPSGDYLALYERSLSAHAKLTADAIAAVAQRILRRKGEGVALVSLARAGTPAGILIRRYLRKRFGIDPPHYTISIIRGRGIDRNAMQTILERHRADRIQFVDGWIGKGAIAGQLSEAMREYPGVDDTLAVLADPASVTPLCGTREDFLIPSACLNATVSGLLSRTVLNASVIGPGDYHGAVYYGELAAEDRSNEFLEAVERAFDLSADFPQEVPALPASGVGETQKIAETYGIRDINLVKPGIGEATRVLLRRAPWKLLVRDRTETVYVGHLLQLAREKGVPVEEAPLLAYRAVGLIRDLSADL